MSIFCIEKDTSLICASKPTDTTDPLPVPFTEGVFTNKEAVYSDIVLYSDTPY